MTTEQEIAQLEQELETLRSKYAIMKRNGQRAKVFVQFIVAPAFIGISVLVLIRDFVAGLFVAPLLIAPLLLVWLYPKRTRWIDVGTPGGDPKRTRWIDAGTPGGEYDFGPSEAEKVELWIATRERRLAELRSEK